ncbi:hypothetical protein L288_05545 [Sphingobium quisquiliarum P25]|uniref:Uncharacterized protein n=1 Tax=Sphingobium quisquiliarum P25 TaxID=1329909 RepID=T0GZW6_9SPHN|nr:MULTISPECIES: hypothetical protein [Sphingobium]EQB09551.1 hypothetical protein L288_05545 [Sphingobium quisquiliarum P25]EZP73407.1 putative uncharacterized protein precursor [Sphingomonas paucimobilis]
MRIMTALLPLAAFVAAPAWAGQAERAGHYYLQGVMETGSELMLHPDGRFQWYLVYGALDLFAEGRWQEADGQVVLTAHKSKDVPEPGFETLVLTVKDSVLIPPDGRGAYRKPPDERD